MAGPFDGARAIETSLERILNRSTASLGYFWDLRRVPAAAVRRSLLTGSIHPITSSSAWLAALSRAQGRIQVAQLPVVRSAMRQALREVGVALPRAEVDALATELARERSAQMFVELERSTRKNLSRVIYNARRRLLRNPSDVLLDNLAEGVRPHLGLTRAVSERIASKVRALADSGASKAAVDAYAQGQWRSAVAIRARAAAHYETSVVINTARHRAWSAAIKRGKLPPQLLKFWRDQRDERVRFRHTIQTQMGGIPFALPYPIFGVMHPPAPPPEWGCRCYETVGLPAGFGLLEVGLAGLVVGLLGGDDEEEEP